MSILKPEKIFVDQSDEITFVVEKLSRTNNKQIIIVIAGSAILFSSIISLRILLDIAHTKSKSIILVTEDEMGFNIAQKADLIVVKKISQITAELWEQALNNQIEFQKKLNEKRDTIKREALHLEEPAEIKGNESEVEDSKFHSNLDIDEKDLKENQKEKEIQSSEDKLNDLDDTEIMHMDEPKHMTEKNTEKPLITEEKDKKIVSVEGIDIMPAGDIR